MSTAPEDVRLDEFDQNEWFDVCRVLKPELTREDFDRMWDEFQMVKAERQRKQSLH